MSGTNENELSKLPGVGPATVEKLESAGLGTIMAIAVSGPSELANTAGMSEAAARKIIKAAKLELKLGFEKATDYAHKRDNVEKIGTGCAVFDNILAGGFESGAITEAYGQFGSGKTQLSHLMVVRALIEKPDNKAIFIDTENTFRADRIKDFAEANDLDYEDAMEKIFVARAYNSDHQMLLVDEVEKMVQSDDGYRIIVVDSLTSHFRSEFIGRGTLAMRQQKLNKHMHQLLKLADLHNMIVLVTNQVMANPAQMFGDPTSPIGGHIVGHNSTFRIYMRPGKAGTTYVKLVDSPNLPQMDCNINVVKEGFVDA